MHRHPSRGTRIEICKRIPTRLIVRSRRPCECNAFGDGPVSLNPPQENFFLAKLAIKVTLKFLRLFGFFMLTHSRSAGFSRLFCHRYCALRHICRRLHPGHAVRRISTDHCVIGGVLAAILAFYYVYKVAESELWKTEAKAGSRLRKRVETKARAPLRFNRTEELWRSLSLRRSASSERGRKPLLPCREWQAVRRLWNPIPLHPNQRVCWLN
jgi:hypothetical protein